MRRVFRSHLPGLLAALLVGALAPSFAGPIPYQDLRRLLQAEFPEEVVLAIVQEEGAPRLSSNQWLELRSLGASDRLLVALLPSADPHGPAPTPTAGSPPPEPVGEEPAPDPAHTRTFYEHDREGHRVLVLTNLDEEGRRLGGEVARPTPRNQVTSRRLPDRGPEAGPLDPGPEPRETASAAADGSGAHAVASGAAAAAASATVLLPEYVPSVGAAPAAFVSPSRYYGFFYPYPLGYLYPPGSYTHLKLYHENGRPGFSSYTLPAGQVFHGPLFPSAGSHPRGR